MKDQPQTDKMFEDTLANLQYVLIARRVQASDEPMRLNWKHFDIMALIKEKGSIIPSAISETLQLSRSSTSKYLKNLKEKGLVKKLAKSKDRRSHGVALTKQADKILKAIYRGQRLNALQAKHKLSPEEVRQFIAIAKKIISALDSDDLHTV